MRGTSWMNITFHPLLLPVDCDGPEAFFFKHHNKHLEEYGLEGSPFVVPELAGDISRHSLRDPDFVVADGPMVTTPPTFSMRFFNRTFAINVGRPGLRALVHAGYRLVDLVSFAPVLGLADCLRLLV